MTFSLYCTENKVGAPRGQKRPLRPREVWAIRARIEISKNIRNFALFNLAIDSKLRGCDLVRLKVSDVYSANAVRYLGVELEDALAISEALEL